MIRPAMASAVLGRVLAESDPQPQPRPDPPPNPTDPRLPGDPWDDGRGPYGIPDWLAVGSVVVALIAVLVTAALLAGRSS